MATTITAGNATNGAAISSDNTGILELKTGSGSGTTALTLGTTGNINFPISGQRITGDFSTTTFANRAAFQSSTVNGNTAILALPNGTGTTAQFQASNNSDPTNSSLAQLAVVGATDVRILSGITGTGTYLPMTFYTSGSERMRVDTSGNVGIGTTSPGALLNVNYNSASFTTIKISNSVTGNTSLDGFDFVCGTSGEAYVYNRENQPLIFGTNNTERMRIDSSGNVLIGTTTQATGAQLTVNGSIKGTITSGSAQTAPFASPNTSCDFTGIPSWVKRITVMFNGVSTNGTSILLIQLGDSGGVETTGYSGSTQYAASYVAFSSYAGIPIDTASTVAAGTARSGVLTLSLLDTATNTWSINGGFAIGTAAALILPAGIKATSATLDRIRITTVNGTDTFDAGTINILYEG